MDMTAIALSALGGVLGACAGLLLGLFMPGRGPGRGLRLGNILALTLAVAGGRFGPAVLEPMIGSQLSAVLGRDETRAAAIGDGMAALFETHPVFIALGEADPQEAVRMRTLVEAAYREGGNAAARSRAEELGREMGERAVRVYGPRASDEALRQFFGATRDLGYAMQQTPRQCYSLFYASLSTAPALTTEAANATANYDTSGVEAGMAAIVRSAVDEPVPFDAARAVEIQQELGARLMESYTPQDLRFMLGAVPQDNAEMQLACDVMLASIDLMLAHEDSATMLRSSLATF
tara:strand:- start:409 stop:1284 length:876 start_codon:yes stop_codon:yes gene_type:complete